MQSFVIKETMFSITIQTIEPPVPNFSKMVKYLEILQKIYKLAKIKITKFNLCPHGENILELVCRAHEAVFQIINDSTRVAGGVSRDVTTLIL